MGTPKDEQILTLHRALALVDDFICAIDGGAADGTWTQVMALQFAEVHAFEPHPRAFEVLHRRLGDAHNVRLYNKALWDGPDKLHLEHQRPGSTKWRGAYVQPDGDIDGISIDSLELQRCGLIKLDLEGAEMIALRGAQNTIKRHKPVVIVECKRGYPELFQTDAEAPGKMLTQMGAVEAFRFGPDRVYRWEK